MNSQLECLLGTESDQLNFLDGRDLPPKESKQCFSNQHEKN